MTTIEVLNLKCGGCANTIKNGLLSLDNIKEVSIDIEKSLITVDTENQEDLIIVKEKLQKMGYPQVGDENTLVHKAKSFVSCATGRLNN